MPHTFCLSNIPPSSPCTNKCHLLILLHTPRPSPSHSLQHLSWFLLILSLSLRGLMAPELEKPRITEIQVRMDCNGCVQKIKKALHGINGIYDLYIDFPHQKLTIIGWADPEKIVKAIRKTRKIATICSHTEQPDQPAAQPTEQPQQAPEGGAKPPPSDAANPPPAEAPQQKPEAHPAEPSKDPPPPTPQNPPPEDKPSPPSPSPSPVAAETNPSHPGNPPAPKDVGEIHVIYHHPPDYGHRYSYGPSPSYDGHCHRYPNGQGFPPEPPQPIYVTHSYNTYRPSPYVTEYQYVQSPPGHTFYSRMGHYSDDYHDNSRNGNITSIFSDENPNACRIV